LADVSVADNVSERGHRKNLIITGNIVLGDIKVKVKK
jgi:hypothetical protein